MAQGNGVSTISTIGVAVQQRQEFLAVPFAEQVGVDEIANDREARQRPQVDRLLQALCAWNSLAGRRLFHY